MTRTADSDGVATDQGRGTQALQNVNRREKLSDRVAADLEMLILREDFAVGERLPTEAELGERLGVSRTVVRDAVRTLTARGLVSVRQGYGTYVAPSTDDALGVAAVLRFVRSGTTVGEMIDARAELEARLLPLAAVNRTDEDVAEASEALDAFRSAVDQRRWKDAHAAHLRFHLALVAAVQMPVLEVLLKPLAEIILISSVPPRGEDPELWEVEAHVPILAALRDQDGEGIAAAIRAHYEFMNDEQYRPLRSTPLREAIKLERLREYIARH